MATKFFLLDLTAPYIPPTWQGGWDQEHAGTATHHMDPYKFGGNTTAKQVSENTATTPWRVGVYRGVSRRIAPGQTISGTLDVVLGVSESNADADFYTRLHVYVAKSSDDSVVGTLLNEYEESSGGGGTEWTTTITGTALQSAQSVTTVAVPDDGEDYHLVAEIGCIAYNSHTTLRTANVRHGGDQYANSALNSLEVGSTASEFPYIEFSADIALADDVIQNVTWETATEITALPAIITQNVHDTGIAYGVFYKRTYSAIDGGNNNWTAFGKGSDDVTTYLPTIHVYPYDPSVHTTGLPSESVSTEYRPTFFGVDEGITYILEFETNDVAADPAVLTLTMKHGPANVAPAGSFLINDDSAGFPAQVLSFDGDNLVLRAVYPFASGEAGDALPSAVLFSDADGTIKLYDNQLAPVSTISFDVGLGTGIRAHPQSDSFFVARSASPVQVKQIGSDGTELASFTLTGQTTVFAVSANVAGDVIYTSRTTTGQPITRHDASGTALSNLAAGVTGYRTVDIINLEDDSVLVGYFETTTGEFYVRRYDSLGNTLQTYALETSTVELGTTPRITGDINDPDSFYVQTHPSTGVTRLRKVDVNTGGIIVQRQFAEFQAGVFQGAIAADPEALIGPSSSCPLVMLPATIIPTLNLSIPCCPCPCPPALNPKTITPVPESHPGEVLPPVVPEEWEQQCDGGGDVPTADDPTDSESWVS